MTKILVIEKRGEIRRMVERCFGPQLALESALTFTAARERLAMERFDIIIWDLSTPTADAKFDKRFQRLSRECPPIKLVVISKQHEPDLTSQGNMPCEWVRRPFNERELVAAIEISLGLKIPPQQPFSSGAEIEIPIELDGILAVSLAMRSVLQQITEAAAEDIPVLITGETGTGKDLVAAAIHKRSKRKNSPYLAVNMGAIVYELVASELFGHEKGAYTGATEGRAGFFEQAHGGTIFLDEITTMDEKTQVSLLRVLETQTIRRVRGERDLKINVRVLAATNQDIEQAVREGRFREDLYYRLDVFRIHIPPLRDRRGGVSLLTDHFVSRFDDLYKKDVRVVSPDTYRLLRRYPWPGNVRELKNVIQRAVLLAKSAELTPDLLPPRIRETEASSTAEAPNQSPIQVGMALAEIEREFIKMTLASVSGNKRKAASILGISRRALYNKLKRFGIL
ncbi:MAG TPA: sigma-54 dependent transcriptional regulator [Candidatus Binatia bacterium]|nr:sigma-54 dependent transcriptional regulator [Candidatus Binatia bacterium]